MDVITLGFNLPKNVSIYIYIYIFIYIYKLRLKSSWAYQCPLMQGVFVGVHYCLETMLWSLIVFPNPDSQFLICIARQHKYILFVELLHGIWGCVSKYQIVWLLYRYFVSHLLTNLLILQLEITCRGAGDTGWREMSQYVWLKESQQLIIDRLLLTLS